jgi:hypothetical protein
MSLAGCTVGAMVAWPPMRELAENIDALAVALNTPSYTRLVDIADAPFQFTDKVAATGQFYQFFSVSSSGMVEGRYLAADELGAAVYTFPETNLGELMAHDELYFVMDQDDCLCKTLFKVEGSPELPTFVETSASGCCQTLPVPEADALIYQGQHFFPSAILAGYFGTSFEDCCECCIPSANPTSPACLASSDATMYVKTGEADENGCFSVTGVSRNIVSGYFTWPFKKRYMELLVDKLNYILDCERNDGLKPRDAAAPADVGGGGPGETLSMYGAIYSVDGGTTNSGWFKQGSTCSPHQVDQWLASLWIEGAILDTEPGTLVYGTGAEIAVVSRTERGNALSTIESRGAEEITDSPYDLPRPWDGPTPPAETSNCSNGLPKVYAYTLNKLNDLVLEISQRVWPYGTFDAPSYETTCDDTTLVPCCHPDNGYVPSGYTARQCELLGGRQVADSAECDTLLEALCVGKTVRYCGSDIPCTYYAGTGCVCPPESCYEYFTCCNTAATSEAFACAEPVSVSNFECPPGYSPATFCNWISEGACCYMGSVVAGVVPVGINCPDHPEIEGAKLDYCEFSLVECGSFPQGYSVYYTGQLNAPSYPELPLCANQNPCCLLHPPFESDSSKNCLSYLDEIQAWVTLATDGAINSCRYADPRLVDPTDPDSLVEDCQQIRCGLVCEDDYETLSVAVEECLNQAQIMYSWQRREVNPEDTLAGWPLSNFYDIVFTAPSPI